jgi:hypothetical protein
MIKKESQFISPKTVASNDCLNLILSFAFDKLQCQRLLLLNKKGSSYFRRPSSVGLFKRPAKTLTINHASDPKYFQKYLPQLSSIFDLKLNLNISLDFWNKVICSKNDRQCSQQEAIVELLSHFEIRTLHINFQLRPIAFDRIIA